MGLLRIFLALSVVLDHLGSKWGTGGAVAVETFFIVSGFYMALILERVYSSPWRFWANRALRIFPTYWFCAALSLVLIAGSAWWTRVISLPAPGAALLVGSNALIFGQDITLFVTSAMTLTPNFRLDPDPLWHLLLVPQAWTLSLELAFYLLAPWLVRRSTTALVVVIAGSMAVRLGLASVGLDADPWSYRFLPSELALFVLGILSFRLYERGGVWRYDLTSVALLLGVGVVMGHEAILRPLFYVVAALLLPNAFRWSRSRFDRYLGDLSYPIYLSHSLVIGLAPTFAVPATLALSIVILAVVRPIDRIRTRVRSRDLSLDDRVKFGRGPRVT